MSADPEVLRGLADKIEVRIALADRARGKAFEREIEALGDILYVRGKEIIAALRAPQKDGAAARQERALVALSIMQKQVLRHSGLI